MQVNCITFLKLCNLSPEGLHGVSHKQLFERLHSVRSKWYTIGIHLDVPPGDLNAMAQEHGKDCDRCLSEVLYNWERRKSNITWEDVIGMLISPAMKDVHLAKEIKQEFKVRLYLHFGSCMKVL